MRRQMKNETEEKKLTDEEEEVEAWRELWEFANNSIDTADISISLRIL